MKARIPVRALALLFLPCAGEYNDAIRAGLDRAQIEVRELSPGQLNATVQACYSGNPAASPPELTPDEAVAIFCGVSDRQLDRALAALRGLPVLKAVMTETNRGWTVIALYRELCRERDAIRRQKEDGRKA